MFDKLMKFTILFIYSWAIENDTLNLTSSRISN